jgi:hypothetical protein
MMCALDEREKSAMAYNADNLSEIEKSPSSGLGHDPMHCERSGGRVIRTFGSLSAAALCLLSSVAMGQIAGYGWEKGGTKQVAYLSGGHIHELVVGVGGTWNDADLTNIAGAPPPMSGFGVTKQVAYLTSDDRIHELVVGVGGTWSDANLTKIAGAPLGTTGIISGYGWEKGGTKQVAYTTSPLLTSGGHIHELVVPVGGTWSDADLTSIAGAPPPFRGNISGYGWERGGTKQVAYITGDDHVHELVVAVGGTWSDADLTKIASAPSGTTGIISGYGWEKGGTKQVAYITSDGHIHELVVAVGGTWSDADLTKIAGAPPADLPPPPPPK